MKKRKSHSKSDQHRQFIRAVCIVAVLIGILMICVLHAASGPIRVTKLIVDHKIIVPAEGILVGGKDHD